MLGLKTAWGIKKVKFEEVYDEWSRFLTDSGLVHPLWNQEDCEFVRNTLSSKPSTVELLQEICSFKKQGMWFTYELLGFSHSDIDKVFDWTRLPNDSQTWDMDGTWMKNETWSTHSEEHQSVSFFSREWCQEWNSEYLTSNSVEIVFICFEETGHFEGAHSLLALLLC